MNRKNLTYEYYLGARLFNDEFALSRFQCAAIQDIKNIVAQIQSSDIVFFGDSVMNFAGSNEVKTSIPKYFSNQIKGNIYNFSAGSFSFFLFEKLFSEFRYEFKQALKGKVALFEINMRSFSDEWYIRPTYRFEHIRSWFTNDTSHPAHEIFSDKLKKLTDQFYNTSLTEDIRRFNEFAQCKSIRDIFNYFKVNPDDKHAQFNFYYGYSEERLRSRLSELENLLNFFSTIKKDTKVVFWFCPLNFNCVSEELSVGINKNINYLIEFIKKRGFSTIDLTRLIASNNDFLDKEHLKYTGRMKVAQELAKEVSPFLYHTLNSSVTHYTGGYLRQIEPVKFREYAKIYEEYKNTLKGGCL